MHEIKYAGVRRLAAFLRHLYRPIHVAGVFRRGLATGDIGTVDREARHDLGQRTALAIKGEIAGAAIGFRDARELHGQHLQFARQRSFHDEVLVCP